MEPPDPRFGVSPSGLAYESPRGFFEWLVRLPISPEVWRSSASSSLGALLGALLILVVVADLVIGFGAAEELRATIYEGAAYYEENADPLLLADGRFQLQGDRILYFVSDEEGGTTILIDPESTVPDDALTTSQYLLVRSDRLVLKQPRQTREMSAKDLAEVFGERLFDADYVRSIADTYAYTSVILVYASVVPIFDLLACLLSALAVGGVLLMLRGQYLDLSYSECMRIALATSAPTVALDLFAHLVGMELPLPGILLWPLLMLGLCFVALGSRPAQSA